MISVSDAIAKGKGKVSLRGWVFRERKSNQRGFFVLRDGSNIIQCVVEKSEVSKNVWEVMSSLSVESSILVEGVLVKDSRAPTGFEVHVSDLSIVNLAERFPITKDQSAEFLLDKRHLWIRSRELTLVWKVKAEILKAVRLFFENEKYTEVTPPILTGSACEGGSTLFEVKYFDDKAFLSQSAQLYLEALIFSLEKVWSLTPSFRAEPSRTSRHLTEYWHLEAEAAWLDFEGLLDLIERLVSFTAQHVAKSCADYLRILGRDPADLVKIKPPFPRLTYDEALKLLKKDGLNVEWGKDLRTIEEEALMKHFDLPVFVTKYPKKVKAFYMKNADDKVVWCSDLLAPEGYGEIVGSSERETSVNVLIDKLKAQGEHPDHYEWYLDLRRFGSVPHSGFGLGVERLVRWFCKLDSVRDAIPFPRTINRVYP